MTRIRRNERSRFRLSIVVPSKPLIFGLVGGGKTPPATRESGVEIVAHRGASFLAPENTLAAVNLAWDQDADAVEVDVHLSKDRRIVAIHDTCTRRTAGTRFQIAQTRSSQLRLLNVGHKSAHERIPFLEEILTTVPQGRRLFIEIKCGAEIVPILHRTLERENRTSQTTVIGFDIETLARCKQTMPMVPTYYLRKTRLGVPYRRSIIKQVQAEGLDGLSLHWQGLTTSFAKAVKESGLDLYTWTVDDVQDAKRLASMGIDGVTTNRPGWLRTHLRAPASLDSA